MNIAHRIIPFRKSRFARLYFNYNCNKVSNVKYDTMQLTG